MQLNVRWRDLVTQLWLGLALLVGVAACGNDDESSADNLETGTLTVLHDEHRLSRPEEGGISVVQISTSDGRVIDEVAPGSELPVRRVEQGDGRRRRPRGGIVGRSPYPETARGRQTGAEHRADDHRRCGDAEERRLVPHEDLPKRPPRPALASRGQLI